MSSHVMCYKCNKICKNIRYPTIETFFKSKPRVSLKKRSDAKVVCKKCANDTKLPLNKRQKIMKPLKKLTNHEHVSEKKIDDITNNVESYNDTVITFGKHTGKYYENVYQLYPSYCEWVISKDQIANTSIAFLYFSTYVKTKKYGAPSVPTYSL